MADNKAKPRVSVIERRLTSGQVFGAGSRPIPLKDPKAWRLRIVDTSIAPDRAYTMQEDKGWTYAEVDDLAAQPQEIGFEARDGRIVRGVRGTEVLMKMPLKDYRRVEQAKDAINRTNTFGQRQVKDAMVAGVAAEHGPEAAEYIARNVNPLELRDSRGPMGED